MVEVFEAGRTARNVPIIKNRRRQPYSPGAGFCADVMYLNTPWRSSTRPAATFMPIAWPRVVQAST